VSPPSSSSGRSTFLRLHRRLRQVARPSSGSVVTFDKTKIFPYESVVAFTKLLDLPMAPHHLRQLGRPPQDFTSGMKASQWGARLMALPSISGCLGAS
jgi:hypothetical protein